MAAISKQGAIALIKAHINKNETIRPQANEFSGLQCAKRRKVSAAAEPWLGASRAILVPHQNATLASNRLLAQGSGGPPSVVPPPSHLSSFWSLFLTGTLCMVDQQEVTRGQIRHCSVNMATRKIVVLAALLSTALAQGSRQCYYPDGFQGDPRLQNWYAYIPCGGQNTTFKSCCVQNQDTCLPNGLCSFQGGKYDYRGACESQDWSGCPNVCRDGKLTESLVNE